MFEDKKMCDFGLLGKYPLEKIGFEEIEDYTKEQIDDKIIEIVNKYNENINDNNKKVFSKVYNYCLWGVTGNHIWKKSYFKDIINYDKLPNNFDELDDNEKTNILIKLI